MFHRVVWVGKDDLEIVKVDPEKSLTLLPRGIVGIIKMPLEAIFLAARGLCRLEPDKMYLADGRISLEMMSKAVDLVRTGVCGAVGFTSSAAELCYLVIPVIPLLTIHL